MYIVKECDEEIFRVEKFSSIFSLFSGEIINLKRNSFEVMEDEFVGITRKITIEKI
jgi:hypothetical protein